MTFPKVERHTKYTATTVDGLEAVGAQSECSASAWVFRLEGVDLEATPRLRWRWRVDEELHIEDERVKDGDDFAARVYVIFPFDSERASRWRRLRHALASRLHGSELPGGAINYVWSSSEPAGRHWDNPFSEESKMISLGRGPLGEWKDEEVDVLADYERLFGEAPPEPVGLAVMSDSDNSCQKATAYVAAFRFVERPPSGE